MNDNEVLEELYDAKVYYNKDILFVPHYRDKGVYVAPGGKYFQEKDLQSLPRKMMMLWKRTWK